MTPITQLSGLSDAQERAIVAVSEALPGAEIILVGALGLGHHIEMSYRVTDDVDLIVGVELDEFPGPLPSIAGWRQGAHEHRFHSAQTFRSTSSPRGQLFARPARSVGSGIS